MTNFVYVSPAYPSTNVEFCLHLARSGVRVLGVGDGPYEELPHALVSALGEYYRVNSLEDYDQAYRAVAYFAHRYGRIEWLESNNEYWLGLDARLRSDFNITTGRKADQINEIRSKARMKPIFRAAGIPTARQIGVTTQQAAERFVADVGYPVIVKPEIGVGATQMYRLDRPSDLHGFFAEKQRTNYVMEEFVDGDVFSYDGIVGADANPVFETATHWPPSILDIVRDELDLSYRVLDVIPPQLRDYGLRTLKAFGVHQRWFHLEFFRLRADKPGLGKAGEFVALEVNMRPAGGATLDMYNYARSADVYQVYADMVTGTDTGAAAKMRRDPQLCVYASRRDKARYRVPRERLLTVYGAGLVQVGRNAVAAVPQLGNEFYLLRTPSQQRADQFCADVLTRA